MFSKRSIPLFLLALLSGCSLRLNDNVTKQTTNVSTGGCLSKAGDVLDHYEKGSLSAEEHDAFYSCVNKALTTFVNFADGKNREYFEPGELGRFLSRHFLNQKSIPEGLTREAMALKVAIIGGSHGHITREELRLTSEFFQSLQQLTGNLRPFMPITAESMLARNYTPEEFDNVMRIFVGSIVEFGSNLKREQGAYAFANLAGLVRELGVFLYGENVPKNHWTQFALRMAKAMPPAKAILISHPRDQITKDDWKHVYQLAPRYYAALLRLKYYMQNPPMNTMHGGGLKTIERLFGDFVAQFNYVIDQHPGQMITSEEIDDFVLTFYDQGLLPCRPDTARQFIKVLFGRILGSASDPNKFFVTKDSLSRFKRSARFVLEGFRAAEALYRSKHGDAFFLGMMNREEINAVPTAFLLEATSSRNALALEAVEALKRSPFEVRTVFAKDGFSVTIPKRGDIEEFSYMHTLRMFGLRSLNRLIMEAYGDARTNQLSEAQVNSFMNDIFPLLIDLQFVDESTRESMSKRLFEASLFLYSSDGDRGLTMGEALELEALLFSTLTNAPRIHNLLAQSCAPEIRQKAKNGTPLIPGACYRQAFLANIKDVWSYLPGLAEYASELSEESRGQIFDRMDRFLRKGKTLKDNFTAADSQAFVLLPYYVELLFSRFDHNGDGLLDNNEAEAAYPVFRPFIAEKAAAKGLQDPKDHKAVFDFLLAYRTLPTDKKWDYFWRRYLLGPKHFRIDRGQVVEIFEKLLSL